MSKWFLCCSSMCMRRTRSSKLIRHAHPFNFGPQIWFGILCSFLFGVLYVILCCVSYFIGVEFLHTMLPSNASYIESSHDDEKYAMLSSQS